MKHVFAACLLAAPLLPGAEGKGRPLLENLPQNAIQSAFQVLRRDYIRREDLTFEELNRAALQGLLERLDFGAEIVAKNGTQKTAAASVLAEFLAPGIGYIRPETFGEGEGTLFEKALSDLADNKAEHLILDLRAGGIGLFDEAALILQCFIPQGEMMFKMKQLNSDDAELFISKHAPLWDRRVVVLVDGETGNAAEAVAACLRARGRALILGEKTRGATVRFAEVQLDENATLRYASAEMMLPDGTSFFKKGLSPHFAVSADMDEKHQVFAGSHGKTLAPYVRDRVRPRFNERALVRGQNPELDDYVRRSTGQALPGDQGQVRDVVTQRALDLLQSRDFTTEAGINWKAAGEGPAAEPVENVPKALPAVPVNP
jgi:hypothetical protein